MPDRDVDLHPDTRSARLVGTVTTGGGRIRQGGVEGPENARVLEGQSLPKRFRILRGKNKSFYNNGLILRVTCVSIGPILISDWGPPAIHYALYEGTLATLHDGHPLPQVRRWARTVSRDLPALGVGFDREDDERHAKREL